MVVFSFDTHLGKARSGMSLIDDSNRGCEAYLADALGKHISPDFAKEVCKLQYANHNNTSTTISGD